MNPQEAFEYLKKVVEDGYRHDSYDICVSYAINADIIHSDNSEGQRSEIERYRPSEHYPLKDRRVDIDNPVTRGVLSSVYAIADSLWRVDGISTDIQIQDQQIKDRLTENYEAFWGRESLHEYLFWIVNHYNRIDPNAWLVFEHKKSRAADGTVTDLKVYPLIVTSSQAIDYKHDESGNCQHLIILRMLSGTNQKGETVEYEEYFGYFVGFSIHFLEDIGTNAPEEERGYTRTMIKRDKKDISFFVRTFENGLTRVPAAKIGAYKTMLYDEFVRELFVQPALGFLKALIHFNNTSNVSIVTHAFPERYEYTRPCNHENEQGICDNGYYGGIRTIANRCQACQGKGFQTVFSEQLVKRLPLPENPEDAAAMVELSKLVHYVDRPIDLLQFLDAKSERTIQMIARIIYNQELIELNTRAPQTATQVKVDYDRQYHKLLPIIEQICNLFELGWLCGMEYYGATGDARMTYPADLNLYDIDTLLAIRARAVESGAPAVVVQKINMDILRKQYRSDEVLMKRSIALEEHRPFKDKQPGEIAMILSTRAQDDFQKQLWENFDFVQLWVVKNYGDVFHMMPYERQIGVLQEGLRFMQENGLIAYSAAQNDPMIFDEFETVRENADEEE